MLELKEMRLKKPLKGSTRHNETASSSTALVTTVPYSKTTDNHERHQTNNRGNRRGNQGRGRYKKFHQWSQFTNWNFPPQYWNGLYGNWQGSLPQWVMYPSGGPGLRSFSPHEQHMQQHETNMVDHNYQPTRDFAEASNTMTLADSGASSHLAASLGNLHSVNILNTVE